MTDPVRVGVVGVTGYTGFELARLLLRHPILPTPVFFLRNGDSRRAPRCLSELFPQLRGVADAPCRAFSPEAVRAAADVVFVATPHEASLELVPELVAAGLRVVDLSGAFRFRQPQTFSHWYKLPGPPEAICRQAVYGLPELYAEELRSARLVANPGCYPTSVILALRPLLDAGWVDRRAGVVCDCKSGASGAGKELKRETHFVEVHGNFRAYGLFTHRHTPEIAEHAGLDGGDFTFTTHLLPVARGILSTVYVRLEAPRAPAEVEALYRRFYAGRPMVRLWPAGTLPELQHVAQTNFCDLGFALDESGTRLVVVSCLDNLGKGAAGQAVQNLNLMLGCEEDVGLR
jgi:N-acetyl-gamma-glutamyl-phosphate reductase